MLALGAELLREQPNFSRVVMRTQLDRGNVSVSFILSVEGDARSGITHKFGNIPNDALRENRCSRSRMDGQTFRNGFNQFVLRLRPTFKVGVNFRHDENTPSLDTLGTESLNTTNSNSEVRPITARRTKHTRTKSEDKTSSSAERQFLQ